MTQKQKFTDVFIELRKNGLCILSCKRQKQIVSIDMLIQIMHIDASKKSEMITTFKADLVKHAVSTYQIWELKDVQIYYTIDVSTILAYQAMQIKIEL